MTLGSFWCRCCWSPFWDLFCPLVNMSELRSRIRLTWRVLGLRPLGWRDRRSRSLLMSSRGWLKPWLIVRNHHRGPLWIFRQVVKMSTPFEDPWWTSCCSCSCFLFGQRWLLSCMGELCMACHWYRNISWREQLPWISRSHWFLPWRYRMVCSCLSWFVVDLEFRTW